MAFTLGPKAAAASFRVASFDTIGSTNSEAMARARAGDRGPLWVVSREQSAGRGRRGRPWDGPRGNLAASLLKVVDAAPSVAATLSFAAGLAAARAVLELAPALAGRVTLKWPNDVMVDGAKLAGILIEAEPAGAGLAVVVGIGVNVASAPDGLSYPATSLRALDAPATAEALFTALAEAWPELEAVWDEGRGVAAIRTLWLEKAAGLGALAAVSLGEEVARGVFETIDEEGRLVLRNDRGALIRVAAGEVQFGAAATAGAG